MNRTIAFLLAALLTASSLPASAQIVRDSDYWSQYASKIPIGSTITVRTTDGERMTATLTIVDDQGITVEPRVRVPEAPRRIAFDSLRQVEVKQSGSGTAKAVAIGVGVGVASFFGTMLVFWALMND